MFCNHFRTKQNWSAADAGFMNGITKWPGCPVFHREIWSTYWLATRFSIYGLLTMYLSTKVSQKETLACQNNRCEHFIMLTGYLTNFFILEFIYLALEAVKLPADLNSSPSGIKYLLFFLNINRLKLNNELPEIKSEIFRTNVCSDHNDSTWETYQPSF